jgi:hypothetical protein
LATLGVSWLPSIEMDSLELIETYVEAGYGLGLSVGRPQSKTSSPKIRVIELPNFPSLQLGLMHRKSLNSNDDVKRVFLEEVRKQAAHLSPLSAGSKNIATRPQNKNGPARPAP